MRQLTEQDETLRKMQLLDIGEIGLIKHLTASMSYTPDVLVGAGDDAAVVKLSAGNLLLMTTDMLVEDVHFTLAAISPYQLGWKSMAVNMSDIAAMGGIARWAVIGIGMPANTPVLFAEALYAGMQAICRKYNTQLVGGDTVSSDRIVINITLAGEVEPENLIQRKGARVGDLIVVTNTVGDAGAGLAVIKQETGTLSGSEQRVGITPCGCPQPGMMAAAQVVVKKHLEPVPGLLESRRIVQSLSPTAMIDISDGLAIDLCRLAEASRVGVRIYEDRIPISEAVIEVARGLTAEAASSPFNPSLALEFALSGGEDYELLFTMPLQKAGEIDSVDVPLRVIGEVTPLEMGLIMVTSEGVEKELMPRGYEHFRAL